MRDFTTHLFIALLNYKHFRVAPNILNKKEERGELDSCPSLSLEAGP
jgi:hypothetical protein